MQSCTKTWEKDISWLIHIHPHPHNHAGISIQTQQKIHQSDYTAMTQVYPDLFAEYVFHHPRTFHPICLEIPLWQWNNNEWWENSEFHNSLAYLWVKHNCDLLNVSDWGMILLLEEGFQCQLINIKNLTPNISFFGTKKTKRKPSEK